MTDSLFYGSQWDLPSRAHQYPAMRPVPVGRQMPVRRSPDRFVRSVRTRAESALMIQKVFRAFLARKSVKRIAAIKREVDEVEWRISKEEIVDLIRRDPKERLKVNETLMSLLFRLDSVRGVNSGVRDCRKSVIKRAIALQEKVDAIAYPVDSEKHSENDDPSVEIDGSRSEKLEGSSIDDDNGSSKVLGSKDSIRRFSTTGAYAAPYLLPVCDDCPGIDTNEASAPKEIEGKKGQRNGEVLEKIMEQNDRLVDLVTKLSGKNEAQTRLLYSLSQRVEHLERAFFKCEKLGKGKRMRQAAAAQEPSSDPGKSGKKL